MLRRCRCCKPAPTLFLTPCSGTGVEARAARLGLGRVSVVRGEGRLAGTPCIDDTIRSLEPVADHLTRYSGLVRAACSLYLRCPCKSIVWEPCPRR